MPDSELTPDRDARRIRAIQIEVAREAGVTLEALLGKRRKPPRLLIARRRAVRRAQAETGSPWKEIGRLFGGRHHTTVIRAARLAGEVDNA